MKIFNFKQILKLSFLFGFILTANLVFSQKDSTEKKTDFVTLTPIPEFPGGEEALNNFLISHIIYPPKAKENKISGTVYVKFRIEVDGSISECIILKSVHELLDNEAIRVVKSMPKWIPVIYEGKPIKVWFIIPIKFK